MSSFEDIDNGRLIYTCNCGWVDLGHANPQRSTRKYIGAVTLWEQITNESGLRSKYDDGFQVIYKQDMRRGILEASSKGEYFVKRGLDLATQRSVALTIFQEISISFETLQGQFPYGIFTRASSFSQEDLVSNLIGFYRAVFPNVDFLALCKPVSKDASKEVWRMTGSVGSVKNRTLLPLFKGCKDCKAQPAFPKKLQQVKAAVKEPESSPPKRGVLLRDWSEFDTKNPS